MSKTTQENPAVENSATENVSNTSTGTKRTSKSTNTASRSNTSTTKTTRTRTTSRAKTTASTQTKAPTNTKTSVQQDKIMSQNTVRRVAIIGGNRIPFARSNGAYFSASNTDMFTAALNGLVERFNLQGQRLGEVVLVQYSNTAATSI